MEISEKPRSERGILTVSMRKRVLSKAVKASELLLSDTDPAIRLSASHAILQSVALLGKLENPVKIRAEKAVKGLIAPIQLSGEQIWEFLEKLS